MGTLFSDDFESGGLANWTGTNGSITVDAAAKLNGSFGCDANTVDQFAFKDFTAPASKIVTHGAYVKLVSASGTGIARILQISDGVITRARLIYDNGTYNLFLKWTDTTDHTVALSPQPTTGTWYHVQLVYDWSAAAPVTTCYIDGASVATLTDGGFISSPSASRVFVLAFVDSGSVTAQTYFDDVLVEDTLPASGTTYTDAGQATALWVGSAADVLIFTEAGGASSAWTASGADAWTMVDAGQALSVWSSGALDTMLMTDAGGGVLVAVASGTDGSAPAVQLPYQGDATIYDSAGATGSITGGTILATGTIYDSAGATGSTSGSTIMPSETNYD